MQKEQPVRSLLLDIGGVLLTNGSRPVSATDSKSRRQERVASPALTCK